MDQLATRQKSENTIKLPESDSNKDVGNDQPQKGGTTQVDQVDQRSAIHLP
jgi:hypothetical protein